MAISDAVQSLCPECGFCCNGVLFGDVELRASDKPRSLAKLGLTLFEKGRKLAFRQPCRCFDGKWCRIYEQRPANCGAFECGLLKRVAAGEITVNAAHKTISRAKAEVKHVEALLRVLGETDENLELMERYARAMSAPMDLSRSSAAARRPGRLMMAVEELRDLLQRNFLE